MKLEISTLITDTARATGFLTRLPVPARYFEGHDGKLERASRALPLAGLIAALPASLFLLISPWLGFPPLLAAVIAITISIGTTGALHEDGLADVSDGFFGGENTERRLEIMRDSRLGVFGVLALVLSVLLKAVAISAILAFGGFNGAVALLVAGIAARIALVWHWVELESARPGGLADYSGKPDEESLSFVLLTGVPIAGLLALVAFDVSAVILAGLLVTIGSFAFVRLCRDKIGGFTGDTLGASAQFAEIAVLIALACSM
jgi:adenosylcobinamide-GDP ribazoletransferase